MARRFSRRKGKSGSTKPSKKSVPSWLPYKPREIEMLVVKLAKEGKTGSQIGLILRDLYGIVDVKLITKKNITRVLQEKKLRPALPEDLAALIRKRVLIQKHLEQNRKDQPARRGLKLTDSKIHALVRYYKRINRMGIDWKFDPKKATMFVE